MKTVMFAALTALPFLSYAQQTTEFTPFPDNGVYLSATDFTHHKLADAFDTGQPGYNMHTEFFRNALKITQPNENTAEIPVSTVWGERKQGADYRNFNGDFYRVEHADRIFIYSKPVNLADINGQVSQPLVRYYFSREANSPIHPILSDDLKDIYYDQPDKLAAFDELDDVKGDQARKASKLVRLFYTENAPAQSTAGAD